MVSTRQMFRSCLYYVLPGVEDAEKNSRALQTLTSSTMKVKYILHNHRKSGSTSPPPLMETGMSYLVFLNVSVLICNIIFLSPEPTPSTPIV
jgi:hypothetical protein